MADSPGSAETPKGIQSTLQDRLTSFLRRSPSEPGGERKAPIAPLTSQITEGRRLQPEPKPTPPPAPPKPAGG